MSKVTSDKVLKALAERHWQDFFITEVKNGPTGTGMLRMDAVAIKKSWANPCITAYEVKVNRQDFLRDDKWPGYMSYCNRLAFACPEGLIQKEELPPEVGLVWYIGEGKPLKFKRHPVYRPVEIPADFFMYIIMNKIDSDRYPFFDDRKEFFKECVENKKSAKDLGYQLSCKVARELHDMGRKILRLERFKEEHEESLHLQNTAIKLLRDHGLSWNNWGEVKTWVDALEKYMNSGVRGRNLQLDKAIEHTKGALSYLEMIKGKAE